MTQLSPSALSELPLFDSGRISFNTVELVSSRCKQLLIDGDAVFSLPFDREPSDRKVYDLYVVKLRAQQSAEQDMLKNLNSEQLGLVEAWLVEKGKEYKYRLGEEAASGVSLLAHDITQAADLKLYKPTNAQMVEVLYQMAKSLEERNAIKAARKIRVAGNAIPLKG